MHVCIYLQILWEFTKKFEKLSIYFDIYIYVSKFNDLAFFANNFIWMFK